MNKLYMEWGRCEMSELDQIENIIENRIQNDKGLLILEISIEYYAEYKYILYLTGIGDIHFKNKKKMVDWMNENGWKIYTENKS